MQSISVSNLDQYLLITHRKYSVLGICPMLTALILDMQLPMDYSYSILS